MERSEPQTSHLSLVAQQGVAIYREKLKAILEPEHNGEAVAIHVGTGDYAVAQNHTAARRALRERHKPDGQVVTLTIGPPTPTDIDMAYRMLAGQKRRSSASSATAFRASRSPSPARKAPPSP